MPKVQQWFQRWWPVFAALAPVLAAALLWWMAQFFVTEKAHAADVLNLRREAVARWESHTIWAEEVLKRYTQRLDANDKASIDNSAEHKEIRALLVAIREDLAALKAQRAGGPPSSKPTTGGYPNW